MGPNIDKLLVNNLIASAAGCKSPQEPTLFGPIRICLNPRIFRSIRVNRATFTKTTKITTKYSSKIRIKFISLSGNLNLKYQIVNLKLGHPR